MGVVLRRLAEDEVTPEAAEWAEELTAAVSDRLAPDVMGVMLSIVTRGGVVHAEGYPDGAGSLLWAATFDVIEQGE